MIINSLNERKLVSDKKTNAVFLGSSDTELNKVLKYLIEDSANIIVRFNETDLNAIFSFHRFNEDSFYNSTLTDFVSEYLVYRIIKRTPLATKYSDFIKYYELVLNAMEEKNNPAYFKALLQKATYPDLDSLYKEIKTTIPNVQVNIFMNQLDYDYAAVQELQKLVNGLLNKTDFTTCLFTLDDRFDTCECHINRRNCEFYRPIYNSQIIKEKSTTTETKQEKFLIRNIDSHLPEDYFYKKDELPSFRSKKTFNGDEDLTYLGHEELLSKSSPRILPISEEILTIYDSCNTLKDLYEKIYAEVKGEKFIPISTKTVLLGFDAFSKFLTRLERKQPLNGRIFIDRINLNINLGMEVVENNFREFVECLMALLKENPKSSFIPFRGLKRSGSLAGIGKLSSFEELLYLNKDRIKEILSIYYMPGKTPIVNTGKKLIYSPNQIKKIAKENFK